MLTPHDTAPGSLADPAKAGAEAVLRRASDELERRILSGDAARAEEYLARHPTLAEDGELALDLIYVEYAARFQMDEPPPREELYARFPQWRAELQRQFQLDELFAEPTRSGAGASGRFRVLRLLARGGIGQVMRAIDTELNREVAVKELQPAHAEDAAVRERFLREAEITGKLEHPGIVPVYGLGQDAGGRPFYAMRLVQGRSLQEALQEFHQRTSGSRSLPGVEFQKLLRRFLHVCETVAFAHSRGIIHRDLKPANILLGPFGETLVVDWGLARATGSAGPQLTASDKLADATAADALTTPVAQWSNELTQISGELIGTPAFMSPEQAAGAAHEVGPAGDVYSLGATLYMLLTGRAPFAGSEVGETLARVAAGSFPRPREISRRVPRTLEAICLKAMARRPEVRYASPRELADDLEHWLADEPVTAAPESLVARAARWGRRHRTPVVAGLLTLLVATVVSLTATFRINNERLRADRERIEANRRGARLASDRGFALTAEYEHGAAMLWFARALADAPRDDAALRRVILTNLDATRHHLIRHRRVFTHASASTGAAFSADGRRLLAIEDAGRGRVWDLESGQMLSELALPSGRVVATGYSTEGEALVAVQKPGVLLVQRFPLGDEQAAATVSISHPGEIFCAAFHPSGQWLGTATRFKGSAQARIWQVSDGELRAEFDEQIAIERLVFQPGDDLVACICVDGRAALWQMGQPRPVRELRTANGQIDCLAFTPDGKRLVAGDSEGCVSCWSVADGRRLFDVVRQAGAVTGVACASDGQTIAAAWDTGLVRTWDLQTLRPGSEQLRVDRFTSRLAFRPLTRQLSIVSHQLNIALWELADLERMAPPLSQRQVLAVAFAPDGRFAITGSGDGTARLRNGASGKVYGKPLRHAGPVNSVAIRPDGELVLTASRDGTARLWKSATGEPHSEPLPHRRKTGILVRVNVAEYSPTGQVFATGDGAGAVRLWDGDTGELLRELAGENSSAQSIDFNPRGELIAVAYGAPENGVRLWDVASGRLLWPGAHREAVRTAAFSPDGRLLITASNDDTARLWDVATGQPVGRELLHRGEVFVAAFSPDGSLAVTGGYDATVRLWRIPSGELVGEPMRHEGIVLAAAFSADGTRLLTGSADRTARLWDVATCLPLSPPLLHRDAVAGVGLSPAGDVALTGRVWPLPAPLPDDPALAQLFVKLATERQFARGDNIEWLSPAALDELAREFHARTGQSWHEWAGGSGHE